MSRFVKLRLVVAVMFLAAIAWAISGGAGEKKPGAKPQAKGQVKTPPAAPGSESVRIEIGGRSGVWRPDPPARPKATDQAAARHLAHATENRIQRTMFSPTEVEFIETPLKDCFLFLKEQHNINLVLDEAEIQDHGVATDTPITLQLSGVTFESILHLLLEPLELDWVIQDEVLKITTQSRASEILDTRVYHIRHLLDAGHGEEELIDTITQGVQPDLWDSVGGPGSVLASNKALVVRQTQRAHAGIEKLLIDLELAAEASTKQQEADGGMFVRAYPTGTYSATELAKVLPQMIGPGTWEIDKAGGMASIRAIEGAVLVKHTGTVQGQVQRLMRELVPEPPPPWRGGVGGNLGGGGIGGGSPVKTPQGAGASGQPAKDPSKKPAATQQGVPGGEETKKGSDSNTKPAIK